MEITIITTGGTIDKDYPRSAKSYCFEIKEPAAKKILSVVNPAFEYKIISILKKDSLDIIDLDRKKIFNVCKKCKNSKILITHGTDTIIETAKVLSQIKNKTIVLVGAGLPYKFLDSDAAFNVGVAIGALNVLGSGIFIAMSGRVYHWNKCKKDPKTGKFIEI